ncbi:hypothetical protein ACQEVX_27320 [Streptomyces syringium]|uniref:hypothetical protein n=1 Tax=Streptomyces syringium TaxID=76729 RepID=UPI003D8BD16B
MPAGQAQIATEPGGCRTITLKGIPILTFHHRTTLLAAETTAVSTPAVVPSARSAPRAHPLALTVTSMTSPERAERR